MGRQLVLMGSGETTATMVGLHRESLRSSAAGGAVLLDTTYGFQENADDLTARIAQYFKDTVGHAITPVQLRSGSDTAASIAAAVAAIRRADWLFAGPGSPTYALRTWRSTAMDAVLHDLLQRGTVVFASAAALTAGSLTIPVYEIYKAGEDPAWKPGLDLLGALTGLRAAVVPHFDNAEGGTHDTRFCYMGERRLRLLEEQMPDDTFILGIDEHTGVRFDLEAARVEVVGRGGMTVRMRSRIWTVPAGTSVTIEELAERAGASLSSVSTTTPQSWTDDMAVHALLDEGRVADAVDALLALDGVERDITTRAAVHAIVLRLGQLAANPAADIVSIIGPYVDALLAARDAARRHGFWAEADDIRNRLNDLQVSITDTPEGSTWTVRSSEA